MTEEERESIKKNLEYALTELVRYLDSRLIPEVGTNLVYALPGARDAQDVAAVSGRIVRLRGKVHPVGGVEFGASDHMARAVLTALRHDPSIRSVANIRFHETVLEILEELLLEICEFDRSKEPPGIQTMDWGVAFCCREGVPDVIFDRGAIGKEPMIRVFGEDPLSVVRKLSRISTRCPKTS